MLDELTQQAPVETDVEAEQRVTALELFFDLVFVFAITQVTAFIYRRSDLARLLQAFAILLVLWFAWSGYVWLGNTAAPTGARSGSSLLAAMAPLLVASLAVPHAFGDDALIFGIAYFAVRVLHLGAYAVLARGDPAAARRDRAAGADDAAGGRAARRRRLARRSRRGRLLVAALAIDYGGLVARGHEGWRVNAGALRRAPRPDHHHRARRVDRRARRRRRARSALAAGVVVGVAARARGRGGDVVGLLRRRRHRRRAALREARGAAQARDRARLVHLPAPTDGRRHRRLRVRREDDARRGARPPRRGARGRALRRHRPVPAGAEPFKRRNVGSFNNPRLVAAAALAAFAPLATTVPALLALALVAAATAR